MITAEEYHHGRYAGYISSSSIRRFLRAPALFASPQETQETPAMAFGSACHGFILEGKKIPRLFKTDSAQEGAEHTITAMDAAVRSHYAASILLSSGEPERTFLWEESGLKCKCRADWWTSNGICVDYKTTTNASPEGFMRAIKRYRYDVQAAWYRRGIAKALELDTLPPFVFIAQEKTPPYLVGVYELDEEFMYNAMAAIDEALLGIRECMDSGEWPGYSQNIETLYQ